MTKSITLTGASGVSYSYEAVKPDHAWKNVAGNFTFATLTEMGNWHVLYVGETSSFHESLPNHSLWPEAASFGCTHVLAHINEDGAQARQLEARDLIESLSPPMNRMHDPMKSPGDVPVQ
jgi:hypothetical protein